MSIKNTSPFRQTMANVIYIYIHMIYIYVIYIYIYIYNIYIYIYIYVSGIYPSTLTNVRLRKKIEFHERKTIVKRS